MTTFSKFPHILRSLTKCLECSSMCWYRKKNHWK